MAEHSNNGPKPLLIDSQVELTLANELVIKISLLGLAAEEACDHHVESWLLCRTAAKLALDRQLMP